MFLQSLQRDIRLKTIYEFLEISLQVPQNERSLTNPVVVAFCKSAVCPRITPREILTAESHRGQEKVLEGMNIKYIVSLKQNVQIEASTPSSLPILVTFCLLDFSHSPPQLLSVPEYRRSKFHSKIRCWEFPPLTLQSPRPNQLRN